MSWLPCIRRGSDRWWLPLSRQAADVLAATLVAGPEDPHRLAALVDQMRVDPPLLIFAALATEASGSPPQHTVTIGELAQRLGDQLMSLLASGESVLGACAQGEDEKCMGKSFGADQNFCGGCWEQLSARFLQLPQSQWVRAAGDWLELTGPPVPRLWRDAWPTIASDTDIAGAQTAEICYAPSQLDLGSLARTLRRGQSLQHVFLDTLQEAKRTALKEFAYGLSHEINNPLANISTRAQTLLRDEKDPGRSKSLQRIIDQTMRAHEMVADLMFYAHPPAPQPNSVDLHEILRSVVNQSLEAVQGRGIDVVVSPHSQRVTLVADRCMLIEAVRSLVRNAIEAVGCDGRVQLACVQDATCSAAVITVCDSGAGLSEAARTHAFDPYFSGREAGRGLGVGLCRVERIAKLHRGDVSLHSGPAGCTARLWLPLAT